MIDSNNRVVPWIQSKYVIRYNWESEANASFRERRELVSDLLTHCESINNEEIKNAARKNALINMVSALEVYFRDLIVDRTGYWITNGFIGLLKKKIFLKNVYPCFKDTTVTNEVVVARYYSFQNIESIASVFGRLTDCDFLKCIDESEYLAFDNDLPIGWYSFNGSFPEWRKLLIALFDKRHKIVHEASMDEILTIEDWDDYYALLSALPYAIDWVFFQLEEKRYNYQVEGQYIKIDEEQHL